MADNQIKKYHVVELDCSTNGITILDTFIEYEFAISFMQDYIDKKFKLDGGKKCFHINKNESIVYEYYYIFPKKALYKLQTIEYIDNSTH